MICRKNKVEKNRQNWVFFKKGRPYYEDFVIERSLLSFKLYHDLALDMDFASFAHGPCWEPTLSHFSIAMSYVTGRWDYILIKLFWLLIFWWHIWSFVSSFWIFSFKRKLDILTVSLLRSSFQGSDADLKITVIPLNT